MAKHLITSALPYVNGVKHLGNLVGSMLPADVYARFMRQKGHEVLFICGSDDHGTPAELGAIKEKQNPADYVAKWHDFQADIYQRFNLSFDWFGSTSRKQNHALTQHFARKLQEQGLIEVRSETMLFSKADDRFLPDRYVEGTCPKCGFAKARGDQCDNCQSVLDPTDLINPYSAISGSKELELRDSKHLYLKQSGLVEKLRAWIDAQAHWPKLSRSIAYKWLDEGLQDRGITRDMKWGVPVPTDTFGPDFASKVFYVWFDAPIGYIAATEEWANALGEKPEGDLPLSPSARKWWFDAKDVTYTEFMGKDNVYFHTLSFPSTLIGSGEPWTLVNTLKSYNWLTYYGGKFSTSMGVGVFTDTALDLLPADYWRYYLIARAPEGDDSEFRWTDMQQVVNKDLADVLGNFINRTLTFTHKNFPNTVPPAGTQTDAETKLDKRITETLAKLETHLANAEMRKSAEALRELWVIGNEYLAEQEPWKVIKTDKDRAATILNAAINLIPLYAATMAPILPDTAKRLMALFNKTEPKHGAWPWPAASANEATFNLPEGVLFTKIADEQVAEWEAKFGNTKV
jgi:methionyl-tRNA synthetase